MAEKVTFRIHAIRTPAMGIYSFQTGDQDSPHCVGPPPHRKSRLRLMKAIRNPPTVWVPPYRKGSSGSQARKDRA